MALAMDPAAGTFRPGTSIDAAASALGVSPSTVRRWVKEGRLPSTRVETPQGHAYRVHLPPEGSETASMAGAAAGSGTGATAAPKEPAAIASMERAEAMATYTRSLLEPLVARLTEQEAIIRDQAETIGSLRAQLAAAEAPKEPEPAPVPEPSPYPAPTDPPRNGHEPRPWWSRWWLTLAGGGLAIAVVMSSCGASAEHPELCAAARDAMDAAAASVDLAINWADTLSAVTVADEVC